MPNLLLIDANALIHRAFHALPPLTAPDGQPIGAIYGLASTLLKTLRDHQPDYIAACLDRPEPTFRKVLFKEYKAHRPPAAEELISQIIKAREMFEKFGIAIFEKAGYEADDIIGTLTNRFKGEANLKITILTGDLDTLQLVADDQVVVQTFKKGVSDLTIYNELAVQERYGLTPAQLPDYKGLVGDPSDNIPGVKGVGPKTAEKILKEHKNLESFFSQLKENDPLTEKFAPFQEQALFSKKLATIELNVPLEDPGLENLRYRGFSEEKIIKYFTGLGFQSLVDRLFKTQARLITETTPAGDIPGNMPASPAMPEPEMILAGWLIDPDKKDISPAALARRLLQKENFTAGELTAVLNQKIDEYGLRYIFEKIEKPLMAILTEMEKVGIKINSAKLGKLSKEAQKELNELAKKIYQQAGGPFNVNSPKQLAKVLFERLAIKTGKSRKTGTGQRSTAEQILQEIKGAHPVIPLILEYRETFKARSTYLEPLRGLIAADGRLHTHFAQTRAATGRLSSEKPNLQNIPQLSKWAQPLRDVFESEKGWRLVSFDYSQIELRILAHESNDDKLKKAFFNDQDIHRLTASQVFNVDLDKVSPAMRQMAKTLNFGVVYGMGANAFAGQSGLTKIEAQNFIKEYFNDFPGIKVWQEKIKAEARTFGFVKNLNGRRRWFLSIISGNPRFRAEAERAAVNMPIQSLGADIIKLAMIKTSEIIKDNSWTEKVRLLLSIHDELLFEIRDDTVNQAAPILKKAMEEIQKLAVPLKVEVKQGLTWGTLRPFSGNS